MRATPDSDWRSPSRPRSICSEPPLQQPRAGQPREDCSGGPPAMADRILLLVAQLGHRHALRTILGQERGVIAEPPLAARLTRHAPGTAALEELLDARERVDVGDHADVLEPAP